MKNLSLGILLTMLLAVPGNPGEASDTESVEPQLVLIAISIHGEAIPVHNLSADAAVTRARGDQFKDLPGKIQLANRLGVNPMNYTVAELIQAIAKLEGD